MTLRDIAYSAGRWTAASLILRVSLQFAQTAVLARLLVPSDFGLMAVAAATFAIATIFVDLGLSNALIHFQKTSATAMSTLYWVNLAASVVIMGIVCLAAGPIAAVFQEPRLAPLLMLVSAAIPLAALGQQFKALAERDFKFNQLALIEVSATTLGFISAVVAASCDAGVYSLAVSMLVAASSTSLLAFKYLAGDNKPQFVFDAASASKYFRYGSYRMGDSLMNSLQMQADLFIGGYVSGSGSLGLYAVPRNLAQRLSTSLINPIVTRVGLPVMAALQEDVLALQRVYLQTIRMTAALNFPVYAVLIIWPEEVIRVFLGSQWLSSADFLRILAVWGLMRSSSNPLGSLVYATGYVRRAFFWNLGMLVCVPFALWLGAQQGGLSGLAAVMVLIQALLFYPLFRAFVRPACEATFAAYTAQFLPPFAATLLAGAAGYFSSRLFQPSLSLIAGLSVMMLCYLAASYWINRPFIESVNRLVAPLLPPGVASVLAKGRRGDVS